MKRSSDKKIVLASAGVWALANIEARRPERTFDQIVFLGTVASAAAITGLYFAFR